MLSHSVQEYPSLLFQGSWLCSVKGIFSARVSFIQSPSTFNKNLHITHVPRLYAAQKVIISLYNDAAQSAPPLVHSHTITLFEASSSIDTTRSSRKDQYFLSKFSLLRAFILSRRKLAGVIPTPCLPNFIMSRPFSDIPATPRVISPSPTPSDISQNGEYFGPMTRSARKRLSAQTVLMDEGIDEDEAEDSAIELDRSRSRSRSPIKSRRAANSKVKTIKKIPKPIESVKVEDANGMNGTNDTNGTTGKVTNGHLSPSSASVSSGWSWRDFSRSPSPLGLIPIHRQWRSFIHRHEIPRKLLHVSIGFFTIWLYISGVQTNAITPYLMGALIPIATVDYVRHNYPAFNGLYVRLLGAFMRETEYAGWNGVIWYLLGAWIVLGFFPKDIGVMGILLLSWCDTAASTVGRAYGRYTPRIRRGKSLAGSLAAFVVGAVTAAVFWGWLAPRTGPFPDDLDWPFMFSGDLILPAGIRDLIGLSEAQGIVSGGLALAIMSLWTGFTAAASEVVDIFGWDDNLTIPVLSGFGMWGFLKIFG